MRISTILNARRNAGGT